jgi:hypothetical protein
MIPKRVNAGVGYSLTTAAYNKVVVQIRLTSWGPQASKWKPLSSADRGMAFLVVSRPVST